MKILVKRFKYLPVSLAMMILFQGCTVYKKTNVSMQDAATEHVKTKVKTINGNLIFKYIIFENDNYYGIKKSKGEIEKTRLVKESIGSIHLKNKAMSTVLTVALPIGVLVGVIFLLQDAFTWQNNESDTTFYW